MLSGLLLILRKAYYGLLSLADELYRRRSEYNHVELRISGSFPEETHPSLLRSMFGGPRYTLADFLDLLDETARDPNIASVTVEIRPLAVGWSQLHSLAGALGRIADSGKTLRAHLQRGGIREYYLASVCGEITVPPSNLFPITGLRSEVVFVKELMDRLEVEADFLSVGKYKSAVEPMTRRSMSKAFRENLDSLLDERYADLVSRIAASRKLTEQSVRRIIDGGPYMSREMVKHGLADGACYLSEFRERVKKESGARRISTNRYAKTALRRRVRRHLAATGPRLALLVLEGQIVHGRSRLTRSGSRIIGADTVRRTLRRVRADRNVGALVLRINSPGGDAFASDLIWKEVGRTVKKKPVVVSMGDVAASGGYYIAMPASLILAEPGTLTGSIGVIAGKVVLRGLYDKLGISKQTLTRGENADLFSDYSRFSEKGRERVRAFTRAFYNEFVSKAASGRGMTARKMGKLAQGRVWTGTQARESGLVDEIGSLHDALRRAAGLAGIPEGIEPLVVRIHPPRMGWRVPMESVLPPGMRSLAGAVDRLEELHLADSPLLALMPFSIEIL